MNNPYRRHVAWALALLCAGVASAQAQGDPETEAQAQRDIERAQQEVQRAQQEVVRQSTQAREQALRQNAEAMRQLEQVRAEAARSNAEAQRQMAEARRQLEQAARDLARLSAENGKFATRGTPGIFLYGGRATLGINLDIESTELGVRVVGVTPNGPAANAGVVAGDVIVAVDGTDLTGLGPPTPAQRLLDHTRDLDPGETVELRVLRDGDYRDLTVETRERDGFVMLPQMPQPPKMAQSARPPQVVSVAPGAYQLRSRTPWGLFGPGFGNLEIVPLTPGLGSYFGTDKGLLVVRASDENSLGLRDGDVILDIGGREPTDAEHALRIMSSFEPGEMLRVTIMRERQRETLEVRIPTADVYTDWTHGRAGV
jgi:C-terminal processing protease CtpA/Prc